MACHASTSTAAYPSPLDRRHPASLLPKRMHHPALLDFVRQPVSQEMIGMPRAHPHPHDASFTLG